MGNSLYERHLEHYKSLPREEVEALFTQRAEQIRQQKLKRRKEILDLEKAILPEGVGSDAISGIEGVHTLGECLSDLFALYKIKRPRDE